MSIPLYERYPGTRSLPRVGLCDLPTPIDRGQIAGTETIGSFAVKRDDLTSALYGGNKVRKLEFHLGQALAEKRKAVLTFGAYGSNHALATAVHARALGLEPHAVLSPQAPGPFAAATLRAHARLGTVIHPVDGWDGRRAAVAAKRGLRERDAIEPLIIPMGGTNAVGATGYVNAALEISDQLAEEPATVVYVAGGTLGTAIGLAVGFAAIGSPTRVVAVRVTPDEVANAPFAETLASETIALLRSLDPDVPALGLRDLRFELRHDWYEPGYGVVTPRTRDAVERGRDAGLDLETTYTGKAMVALLDDAGRGLLADERVVFWDTYNSAPMPAPGDVALLPTALQEYVAVCDELFGRALTKPTEGDM